MCVAGKGAIASRRQCSVVGASSDATKMRLCRRKKRSIQQSRTEDGMKLRCMRAVGVGLSVIAATIAFQSVSPALGTPNINDKRFVVTLQLKNEFGADRWKSISTEQKTLLINNRLTFNAERAACKKKGAPCVISNIEQSAPRE